jgi:hypothetical protein
VIRQNAASVQLKGWEVRLEYWMVAAAGQVFFTGLATQIAASYAQSVLRGHKKTDAFERYPDDLKRAVNAVVAQRDDGCCSAVLSWERQIIAIWAMVWLDVWYIVLVGIRLLFGYGDPKASGPHAWLPLAGILLGILVVVLIVQMVGWPEKISSIRPYLAKGLLPPLRYDLTVARVTPFALRLKGLLPPLRHDLTVARVLVFALYAYLVWTSYIPVSGVQQAAGTGRAMVQVGPAAQERLSHALPPANKTLGLVRDERNAEGKASNPLRDRGDSARRFEGERR